MHTINQSNLLRPEDSNLALTVLRLTAGSLHQASPNGADYSGIKLYYYNLVEGDGLEPSSLSL